MKTIAFQNWIDKQIEKYFLWAIPNSVKPNYITFVRIFLLPILYYYLTVENWTIAFFIFAVAASTDFLDGSMARTRNQITELGKVIDPVADKLLIGTVLYVIGFQYLIVRIFLIFILFEITTVLFGYVFAFKIGKPISANIFGKIKMVLQSLSVAVFLIGLIFSASSFINLAEVTLIAALVFAILASFKSIADKFKQVKSRI